MKQWTASDISKGAMSSRPIEFQCKGEWIYFEVYILPDRVVFGGCCNAGFLESGYILRGEDEYLVETLDALHDDLQVYYREGKQHVSRIVCNERM